MAGANILAKGHNERALDHIRHDRFAKWVYRNCQKYVPISCHCEAHCDEAIFCETEEIASLRSQ
jgi:hypothetical protein